MQINFNQILQNSQIYRLKMKQNRDSTNMGDKTKRILMDSELIV